MKKQSNKIVKKILYITFPIWIIPVFFFCILYLLIVEIGNLWDKDTKKLIDDLIKIARE